MVSAALPISGVVSDGLVAAISALTAVDPFGSGVTGWLVVGLIGLAANGNDEALQALLERARRARDGETVTFDIDSDDAIEALADAIEALVADALACEQELDRKSTLLDSLFEQLPAHVYVKDEDGRHVRTTTPYSYAEYSRPESYFIGKTDLEIYPKAAAREWYEDDMHVIETGEPILDRVEWAPDMEEWMVTSKVPWRGEDGSIRGLIGISQPITEQKQRELALETLHETTQRLLGVESIDAAARIVADAAPAILDAEATGIYRYDEDANRLRPSALSDDFDSWAGTDVVEPETESLLWQSYVTGTISVVDDTEDVTGGGPFATGSTNGLVVPLGGHGVFVAVFASSAIDVETNRLAETVGATTEAVFDRLETTAELRERDAEIEAQNERLRRQVRINETIRGIDQSLIAADSRAELETAVCEQLLADDAVAFAWIGAFDAAGETLEPRAWAGDAGSYLDTVALDRSADALEPAVETAVDGTLTLVETVAANVQREPWRRAALAADFQSVLAVPIALDEYEYGVLSVYATESSVFGDLEATVLAELGESIANAIASLTTEATLSSETTLSLTLRLEESDDFLVDLARATGGTVRYEGLATRTDDETRLFVRTSGVEPATVAAVLADRHDVVSHRLVRADDGVFEVTIRGTTVVSTLVRHGGRPRSITADTDGLDVQIEVSVDTDVRSFVEMLEATATVELRGRTEVTRSTTTEQAVVDAMLDPLTDRQRDVLHTAYLSGFYNWPRDTSGQELADALGVSQPTVNRHLRLGEQAIMAALFEPPSTDEQ